MVDGEDQSAQQAASSIEKLTIVATGNFANVIDLRGVLKANFVSLTQITVNAGDWTFNGGGQYTYFFNLAATQQGNVVINDPPATGADALNFQHFGPLPWRAQRRSGPRRVWCTASARMNW